MHTNTAPQDTSIFSLLDMFDSMDQDEIRQIIGNYCLQSKPCFTVGPTSVFE